VKRATLALALLAGCNFIQKHPITAVAVANSALVVGAGVCAIECKGDARRAADGVLIGELALSSMITAALADIIVKYHLEKL
jgi:hypothetical protein